MFNAVKLIFATALFISIGITMPAFAQTVNSTSGSDSGSEAVVNQYYDNGDSSGVSTQKYDETIRNTPDLAAMYGTSTAPCSRAVGLTGSLPGAGIGILGSVTDQTCEDTNELKIAYATQPRIVGDIEQCLAFPLFRKAREIVGHPCPVSSYPEDQQVDVEERFIKEGYLQIVHKPNGKEVAVSKASFEAKPNPPAVKPESNICKGLNPANKEDYPYYVAYHCK